MSPERFDFRNTIRKNKKDGVRILDSRFLLEVPRGTYRLHQDFFLDSRVSRSALFSKKKDPRGGRGSYSKLLLFQWPRLEERIKNARIAIRGSRRGASFNHFMIRKFQGHMYGRF